MNLFVYKSFWRIYPIYHLSCRTVRLAGAMPLTLWKGARNLTIIGWSKLSWKIKFRYLTIIGWSKLSWKKNYIQIFEEISDVGNYTETPNSDMAGTVGWSKNFQIWTRQDDQSFNCFTPQPGAINARKRRLQSDKSLSSETEKNHPGPMDARMRGVPVPGEGSRHRGWREDHKHPWRWAHQRRGDVDADGVHDIWQILRYATNIRYWQKARNPGGDGDGYLRRLWVGDGGGPTLLDVQGSPAPTTTRACDGRPRWEPPPYRRQLWGESSWPSSPFLSPRKLLVGLQEISKRERVWHMPRFLSSNPPVHCSMSAYNISAQWESFNGRCNICISLRIFNFASHLFRVQIFQRDL